MNDKRQRLLDQIIDLVANHPLEAVGLKSPDGEDRIKARAKFEELLAPKLAEQEDEIKEAIEAGQIQYNEEVRAEVLEFIHGVAGDLVPNFDASPGETYENTLRNAIVQVAKHYETRHPALIEGPIKLPVSVEDSEAGELGEVFVVDDDSNPICQISTPLDGITKVSHLVEKASQIAAALNSAAPINYEWLRGEIYQTLLICRHEPGNTEGVTKALEKILLDTKHLVSHPLNSAVSHKENKTAKEIAERYLRKLAKEWEVSQIIFDEGQGGWDDVNELAEIIAPTTPVSSESKYAPCWHGVPLEDDCKACADLVAEIGLQKSEEYCHANQHHECTWDKCPQLRDGEPQKSHWERNCPLYLEDRRKQLRNLNKCTPSSELVEELMETAMSECANALEDVALDDSPDGMCKAHQKVTDAFEPLLDAVLKHNGWISAKTNTPSCGDGLYLIMFEPPDCAPTRIVMEWKDKWLPESVGQHVTHFIDSLLPNPPTEG